MNVYLCAFHIVAWLSAYRHWLYIEFNSIFKRKHRKSLIDKLINAIPNKAQCAHQLTNDIRTSFFFIYKFCKNISYLVFAPHIPVVSSVHSIVHQRCEHIHIYDDFRVEHNNKNIQIHFCTLYSMRFASSGGCSVRYLWSCVSCVQQCLYILEQCIRSYYPWWYGCSLAGGLR